MAITADILITPPPVTFVTPVPPRAPIAPAGEREAAQNPRRESSRDQGAPLSFRAALSAATVSALARAAAGPERAVREDEDSTARPPRDARLPDSRPIELNGADASDLFGRAVANNERSGRAPAFAAAASHYSASYFAGSSFFARPGETLELTA